MNLANRIPFTNFYVPIIISCSNSIHTDHSLMLYPPIGSDYSIHQCLPHQNFPTTVAKYNEICQTLN